MEPEIDIKTLLTIVYKEKVTVIAVTIVFAIISVIFALSLPNIYKSETVLSPSTNSNSGSSLSGLGQIGGLASLAGIKLGGNSGNTDLAIEILKSRKFIESFIRDNQILVPLMASKGWNYESRELILDEKLYDLNKDEWIREVSPPFYRVPSFQEAYEVFKEFLKVNTNEETGFVKVSFEFYSPDIAKEWLEKLIVALNTEIKEREVEESIKSVQYLEKQLETSSLTKANSIFYSLIEEHTKSIMYANVRDEYAFKTIDPPFVPELKAKPKRAFICVIITFLGGIIGVVLAVYKGTSGIRNVGSH